MFTPQPFQAGPTRGLIDSPVAVRHMERADGVVLRGSPKDLPVTNSAIARRSTPVRPLAIDSMAPLSNAVRTRSGDIARRASRDGARSRPVSWHVAQSWV